MKKIQLGLIAFLFFISGFAQTNPCGTLLNDTFDETGVLPSEWIEYKTIDSVTVANGKLKFEHSTEQPSAYRTFTPITSNTSFSFEVNASRNSVNCQLHLISSTGRHLTSISVGKGASSIKIATTMEGGVPEGFVEGVPEVTLIKNTNYNISAQIDFTAKKVNLYNDGILVYEGAPFLEDAEDIAKLDIQLLYMYNNNGQFYFDNISFLSADENRLNLMTSISLSETLLSTASIGVKYGQYPQAAIDIFQTALNNANAILTNCESTSTEIDNALSALQVAKDVFEATKKDDPVLKLYSEYDFSGEEYEVYCGFYNGNLASFDNWAVSFTLEQGYMVTFAEDINGLGTSKIYIAADHNLQINLPESLQKKISFIRVGPWNDVHKKGIAGGGYGVAEAVNAKWHYNWGNTGSAFFEGTEYVATQWAGGTTEKSISLGERMDLTHYMAFNEPDNTDQSNMTVDKAIEKYEFLLASGLRLGSPSNTDGAKGADWRDEFMTKATEKGLRVDYLVVHYYKKSTPTAFYNWLKALHDKWGIPIWIKEFNYGAPWVSNPSNNNWEASQGLEAYINMLDDTDFVERYSVYTWVPESNLVFSLMSSRDITIPTLELSTSGIMYRDHESPMAYTQEEYEQGANLTVSSLEKSKVLLYPNPVKGKELTINYTNSVITKNAIVKIFDVYGKEVLMVMDAPKQIDVSNLSNGIYLVQIMLGDKKINKKIMIMNQ